MADKGFDGSTVSWTPAGGSLVTLTPLLRFQYDDSPAEVAVTGSADTERQVVAGRSNETLTIEIAGSPHDTVICGNKGDTVVALNDAGALGTFTKGAITRLSCSGRRDDRITTSITIRQSVADA